MKTINLSDPEKSDIEITISKFPDGQQDVVINTMYRKMKITSWDEESFTIKSKFNSFRDLELIICAVKALRRLKVKEIHLYVPYLLGARGDRQFIEGGTSYLVDVIAPIINSLNFESVTVLDVHSDVAAACINNLNVISNEYLVKNALFSIYANNNESNKFLSDCIFVSPDSGALKKIYKIADAVKYNGEIIACSKSRDENGNLSKLKVPLNSLWNSSKDAIIIDDICDGGATFVNIAKEMKANGWKNKIYLIVTHGIFSKGLKELAIYFDNIYTTDSIRSDFDWEQKEREPVNLVEIIKI